MTNNVLMNGTNRDRKGDLLYTEQQKDTLGLFVSCGSDDFMVRFG